MARVAYLPFAALVMLPSTFVLGNIAFAAAYVLAVCNIARRVINCAQPLGHTPFAWVCITCIGVQSSIRYALPVTTYNNACARIACALGALTTQLTYIMTVQIGNGFYFAYIAIAVVYITALALIVRKVSARTAHTILLVIIFCNFALHFIKQFFVPYCTDFPMSLRRSTVENLCAVSTVFFPFIFLLRRQCILHDFMYFIGVCGGLAALAYPIETLGMPPFAFDTLRFYICHINLLAVPLVAAIRGVYVPRLRKFWVIPLMFLAWQTVICLNEFFLIGIGLVPLDYADLLDPGVRNSSFTFGVRPMFEQFAFLLDPLVPRFLKTDVFNINGGKDFYFPVLWMVVPAFVYLIPLYVVISCPFWLRTCLRRRANAGVR